MSSRGGAKKRNAGQALAGVQGKMEEQLRQLEGRLTEGEKSAKSACLKFSNAVFANAQEAFEKCEAINQEVDETRDKAAAEHAAKRAALGAQRLKLEKGLRDNAATLKELRTVQEEADQLVGQLRGKVLEVKGTRSRQQQQQQQQQQMSASLLRQPGGLSAAAAAAAAGSKQERAPKQTAAAGGQREAPPGRGGQKAAQQRKQVQGAHEEEEQEEEEEDEDAGKPKQRKQRRGVSFRKGK